MRQRLLVLLIVLMGRQRHPERIRRRLDDRRERRLAQGLIVELQGLRRRWTCSNRGAQRALAGRGEVGLN